MPLHRRFKESACLRGLHWSTDKKALDSGYYEDARSRRLCDRRFIWQTFVADRLGSPEALRHDLLIHGCGVHLSMLVLTASPQYDLDCAYKCLFADRLAQEIHRTRPGSPSLLIVARVRGDENDRNPVVGVG